MDRWLGAALLGLLLLAPVVQAGPWLQPRGDAAATGFQPEGGPSWPDVALNITLAGHMRAEADAPPLILEDQILFLARPFSEPEAQTYQVLSMDLMTGETKSLGTAERTGRLTIATDGQTVFVTGHGRIHAYPLGPDGQSWTWTGQASGTDVDPERGPFSWCGDMVVEPESLTALCWDRGSANEAAETACRTASLPGCVFSGPHITVVRLNTTAGQAQWTWTPETEARQDTLNHTPSGPPEGLAVSDSRVIVQTREGARIDGDECGEQGVRSVVWAIEKSPDDGTPSSDWRWATELVDACRGLPDHAAGNPSVSEEAVFVKADGVRKLNLGNGNSLGHRSIGEEDFDREARGSGTAVALAGNDVFTTSAQTVYRLTQDRLEEIWSTSLDLAASQSFKEEIVVTPSTVYAATESPQGQDSQEAIYAFDRETGEILWRDGAEHEVFSMAVGHGLLVYQDVERVDELNTTIVVLGRTEASPTVELGVPNTYPEAGERVEVDLSGAAAEPGSNLTGYKAVWGDGNSTGWTDDHQLSHRYNRTGDAAARFLVRDEMGRTASVTQTFHVGQEPPTEPNLIETAFARENQDMTFGVLGILVAVTGGAIGVGRRYRKRSRLEQELEALETGYGETKDRPSECEALLDNRKARARSLALDGKLKEQQVAVIEARAEELRGTLRLGALEEEFAFLPHGLVTKAREMVEDGDITTLEREAFLAALEEDELLTEEQRSIVRERIERWYGRDKGGAAS